jgi:hypothetical protein
MLAAMAAWQPWAPTPSSLALAMMALAYLVRKVGSAVNVGFNGGSCNGGRDAESKVREDSGGLHIFW